MKDLHSHILYGIDDGSLNLEESISLLKHLENEGISELVCTPHYYEGYGFTTSNKEKLKLLNILKEKTNIKIYLGNEVRLDSYVLNNIKNNNIMTINNTKYVLIEFPLRGKNPFAKEQIFSLTSNGYIPILAHPERYEYLTLEELIDLKNMGLLFQSNITSYLGLYGIKAKKMFKKLIKNNLIDVLGTDIHHDKTVKINDGLKKLKKNVDIEQFMNITVNNFDKIINNKDL